MTHFDFTDKTVIITGAASGIGAAQAAAFQAAGATVVGIDLQPISNLTDAIQADVSDPATAATIAAQYQPDIVCNTAGVLDGYQTVTDTALSAWQRILDVDLTSQFLMIKALLPGMLARGHGIFINMSSIAGLVGGGGGVAYTAAKHAVIGLTKQLDLDYAAQGIRANALAPGAINTPMNAADFAGDGKMAVWVARETPAKRWAKPEEVAQLSLFLASDAADYIHGTVIPIDGGWLEK
ncbi:2-dehydro-3-deoxy-D-gluconate 5-dehydrogenase [Lacticaseibacillus paracasei]|uniref:3-oxoacyl-ACP reductase n=1 Tax=Lacticaseibacillus paracasei TaxID=1597 RepID=UPI0001DBDF4B|nr:3-oxoacyl-ACP reductase [Lacticaseibacillus paracasei]ADK19227.1 short-chain alcohol dehydrogenase [Lacticaseibacillus paracasei]MDE3291614.1 3-oxoacyl-ACP reductase [Lacticaseibacillus paracasei]RNE19571.1 2-dehydro-3-deoxy-D-gluconate 5-dehydrogenase [Lacticaseibacillus paracasei]TJY19434.1 3-oxoacyl-ACP reductase [Lacticaseibacillus paracasei]UOG14396.1 3-oxoacyl-ACP reductase [Lacticaseibacillus paracasei]